MAAGIDYRCMHSSNVIIKSWALPIITVCARSKKAWGGCRHKAPRLQNIKNKLWQLIQNSKLKTNQIHDEREAMKISVHIKSDITISWLYKLLTKLASHQNWEKSLHLASSRARYRARHVFLWKIASRFSLLACRVFAALVFVSATSNQLLVCVSVLAYFTNWSS